MGMIAPGPALSLEQDDDNMQPLAHPNLDALPTADDYRQPLTSWWEAHELWRRAFPPLKIEDVKQLRVYKPPTLAHVHIDDPSPEQRAAYTEAFNVRKQAHATWHEENEKRKKAARAQRDAKREPMRERTRPADDGARTTEHRANNPALLDKPRQARACTV